MQFVPIVVETLAAACVFAITIACVSVSAQRDEGPAGGAVRVLMTLLLPSLVLAFAHQSYWPVSLIVSAVLAAVQMRALPARPALRIAWNVDVLAIALVVAWRLYRRWNGPSVAAYLLTTPVLLALLVLLFTVMDRFLPATL